MADLVIASKLRRVRAVLSNQTRSTRDDDDFENYYPHTLEELGKPSGMLGVIFRKAQK
jgi:hypothetical protein